MSNFYIILITMTLLYVSGKQNDTIYNYNLHLLNNIFYGKNLYSLIELFSTKQRFLRDLDPKIKETTKSTSDSRRDKSKSTSLHDENNNLSNSESNSIDDMKSESLKNKRHEEKKIDKTKSDKEKHNINKNTSIDPRKVDKTKPIESKSVEIQTPDEVDLSDESDLVDENDNSITSDDKNTKGKTSRKLHLDFVAYPHLRVFDGFLDDGYFLAGDYKTIFNKLKFMDEHHLDDIQRHAIEEGLFFPLRPHFPKYHLFSSEEANQCIKGKTIYFFGDSYSRQMFIGFGDVLLNRPSNDEIRDGIRREAVVHETTRALDDFLKKRGENTMVKVRMDVCRRGDLACMYNELEIDDSYQSADALLGNILIHHMTLHEKENNYIEAFGKELDDIFDMRDKVKLTWVTGPSYAINRVPDQYRNITQSRPTERMNFISIDLAKKHKLPILDMFSLTHGCKWPNATSDGGHRSRFVNRMKAQMILNNICKFSWEKEQQLV